jgi:hypothetical protein
MTIDGYYTGPERDVMFLELDPAFDAYNAERLRAADTLLLGRRSFQGFRSYWLPIASVRPEGSLLRARRLPPPPPAPRSGA